MFVKNISKKYISIGKTALAPDAEMEVSDAIAATPGIKAMERLEQVRIMKKSEQKAAEEPADASGEGPAETLESGETETVATETTTKRKGRKKAAEAPAEAAEPEATDAQ